MSVFVVGQSGCRLMPVSKKESPFTIKLSYKTGSTTQPGYLGIDTGSQHIGGSVVREDGTVLHKEEISLRDSMTKRKLLEARASLRRGRRYRKTRYRHPKWKPKTRRVYCEVPSLQSKTDHHIRWIRKLQNLLPEADPEISFYCKSKCRKRSGHCPGTSR